jgi:peptidyl-prolyl cis-trans isomerase SurA
MRLRLLAAVALLLAATTARSYDDLDYIVAVVDDDVVLASELVSRLESVRKQMLAQKIEMPPNEVVMNQLLERLIMENIQLQMGERAGVRIDDETLTKALEDCRPEQHIQQFAGARQRWPRLLGVPRRLRRNGDRPRAALPGE